MKILTICMITILTVFSVGCASVSTYNPNPDAFELDPNQTPSISTNATVSLINGQPNNKDIAIGENGNVTWKGNLRIWTDAAINQSARRLKAANVVVSENSPKKLELAITKAELIFGWVMTRSIVNLEVKTGGGKVLNFKGDHRATAGIVYLPKVAMDGAVFNATINMLNDPEILRYLNQ